MATFKEITAADIQTTRTALSQLVDVIQTDVSSSSTRKGYAMFVTASTDPAGTVYSVTSSLFQTVYDQDYTLQVANAIFDTTVGLYSSGATATSASLGVDSSGKLLFSSSSLMMREKIDLYKLHAGKLLGNPDSAFYAPYDSTSAGDQIDEAIFINFKRLFARDKIKRETFAMRFYTTGVLDGAGGPLVTTFEKSLANGYTGSNIYKTSVSGATIFTDVGAAANRRVAFGGDVGDVVNASNSANKVGLIFYDAGIVVLDASKVMFADQHVSGVISAVTSAGGGAGNNATIIGSGSLAGSNPGAKFIPDFFVSASVDDIVDHITSTRFSSGSFSAMTFQNQTSINSTLFFCRASADEFNYSSNPTFTDDQSRIVVIEDGQEDVERTFTFPTTVGLYDANNNLLAVAKFSRPIEKNDEKDLTVRVRLDF
jgi:hypothetical protein